MKRTIKVKIARIIIETEIKNKHRKKNSLKTELRTLFETFKDSTNFFLSKVIQYHVRCTLENKKKEWNKIHDKKLLKLRPKSFSSSERLSLAKSVVHNFSDHLLSNDELKVLSYSLDYHIPSKINKQKVETEFETFYQQLLPQVSELPENEKLLLKSKSDNIY